MLTICLHLPRRTVKLDQTVQTVSGPIGCARFPVRPVHRGLFETPLLRIEAGFTLLELLVVVAIIGLLTAYVGPRVLSHLGKSEATVARAQVDAFSKALDAYRIDVGRYPTTEQGLSALATAPANEPKWHGPYLGKSVPDDPWGRPYIYKSPGASREYEIISYGKDGKPGGATEDADIVY